MFVPTTVIAMKIRDVKIILNVKYFTVLRFKIFLNHKV